VRCFGWRLFDFPEIAVQTDKYGSMTLINVIRDATLGYSRYIETFKAPEGGRILSTNREDWQQEAACPPPFRAKLGKCVAKLNAVMFHDRSLAV